MTSKLGPPPPPPPPPICVKQMPFVQIRYDWTTGAPHDGNEWKKYRVVPHAHPLRTFFMLTLIGLEAKGL